MAVIKKLKKSASLIALSTLLISCAEKTTSQAVNAAISGAAEPNASTTQIKQNFLTPPNNAKPLTWYHVMNSNMSAAGVTKDLEAMAKAGIGGTILFNIGRQIPKGKVLFNTTEHIDLIGHMAKESKRLGLSFGLHNCDGWSSSGGPWVTPEHSMKQITWNETLVSSNAKNNGNLDIQLSQPMTMLDYYKDIAVLAYPSLDTEIVDANTKPTITASHPDFDISVVSDVEEDRMSTIKSVNNEPVWLQFAYDKPVTIRFASMDISFGKKQKYALHYSNDGINFKKHVKLDVTRPGRVRWALDGAFEGVTAKYFRIVTDKPLTIYEAHLSSTPTIGNHLARSSATRNDYNRMPPIGNPKQQHIIDPKTIINLSENLSKDGRLTAKLPKGDWTIMRFGYTAKGTTNIPPTAEGRGLEVDKYSREAFKAHYDAYVTNVINKVNKVAPGVMHSLEIDSYEVGGQNWTKNYEQIFEDKYDYSLIEKLPLFAGKFVGSADDSEAVLWDVRNLNNKLITENYYQYFTELANADGIKTYIEPYGHGPFNDIDAGSKADIPMGEFWLKRNIYMMASSTSAGHIYDKNIISAEAFTATAAHNWKFNPAYAKFDGDKGWALGINQYVFHRFVHQANTHVVPGMTMEAWGAHIDATQPWFQTAGKDWFNYLTRGQYLLRQGQPDSDVLWYVGDAAPTTCPDRRHNGKNIPTYINYDCINREKLQTELFYKDDEYQLNHGVKYKILRLDNEDTLYLQSVRKIYQFAKQGGVIIGKPIQKLAGRDVTAKQQQEFEMMVDFIWSQPSTHLSVRSESDWDNLYKKHNLNYDLYAKDIKDFYYTHRKTATKDIYFVYNDSDKRRLFDASFNVTGKIPELWDARTGLTKSIAAYETDNGLTNLAFRLDANESTFIVFEKSSTDKQKVSPQVIRDADVEALYDNQYNISLTTKQNTKLKIDVNGKNKSLQINNVPAPQALTGNWQVTFEEEYGLDETFTFDSLTNWKNSKNPDIRAYSGIATYRKTFTVQADLLKSDQQVILDLGKVSDSAQVFLNGKEIGIAWVTPFTLNVTNHLQSGSNELTVKVANSWTNRLITDESYPDVSQFWQPNGKPVSVMPDWYTQNKPLPKGKRRTFTTYKFVKKDDPLIDSGLLGPVTLNAVKAVKLK